MPQWLSLVSAVLSLLVAIASIAVTWGTMRESLATFRREIDSLKSKFDEKLDVLPKLEVTVGMLERSARRLHERQDEMDDQLERHKVKLAVVEDRENTGRIEIPQAVPRMPRPIEPSPPPRTKRRDPDDSDPGGGR